MRVPATAAAAADARHLLVKMKERWMLAAKSHADSILIVAIDLVEKRAPWFA